MGGPVVDTFSKAWRQLGNACVKFWTWTHYVFFVEEVMKKIEQIKWEKRKKHCILCPLSHCNVSWTDQQQSKLLTDCCAFCRTIHHCTIVCAEESPLLHHTLYYYQPIICTDCSVPKKLVSKMKARTPNSKLTDLKQTWDICCSQTQEDLRKSGFRRLPEKPSVLGLYKLFCHPHVCMYILAAIFESQQKNLDLKSLVKKLCTLFTYARK